MAICQGDLLTERFLIRQQISRREGREESGEEPERLREREGEIDRILEGLGYRWR